MLKKHCSDAQFRRGAYVDDPVTIPPAACLKRGRDRCRMCEDARQCTHNILWLFAGQAQDLGGNSLSSGPVLRLALGWDEATGSTGRSGLRGEVRVQRLNARSGQGIRQFSSERGERPARRAASPGGEPVGCSVAAGWSRAWASAWLAGGSPKRGQWRHRQSGAIGGIQWHTR